MDSAVTKCEQKAAIHLAIAAEALGDPVFGPPGIPNEATRILRSAYTEMANDADYRAAAAMRSIEVSRPMTGEALQQYAATNLTAIPPDTIREYMSIAGSN